MTSTTLAHHKTLEQALAKLVAEQHILGATLVTRDGLPIVNGHNKHGSPELISAMSAAALGAAETVFHETGGGRSLHLLAESEQSRLAVLGANEELVLVLLASAKLTGTQLAARGRQFLADVGSILGGG